MGGMACVGISRNSYFWGISQISLPDPCVPLQFTTCHIDHTATGMFYSFGCYLNTTLLKIHSIDTMQCGTAWCVPQKALQNEIIGDSRQSSVWITERMRQRHSTEDKLRYSVISMGTQGGAERELEALNKKAGDGESQRRVLKNTAWLEANSLTCRVGQRSSNTGMDTSISMNNGFIWVMMEAIFIHLPLPSEALWVHYRRHLRTHLGSTRGPLKTKLSTLMCVNGISDRGGTCWVPSHCSPCKKYTNFWGIDSRTINKQSYTTTLCVTIQNCTPFCLMMLTPRKLHTGWKI